MTRLLINANTIPFTFLVGVLVFSSTAHSENPVLASARYGGIGGAAVSSAQTAEALVFNPAGLAFARQSEFVFNLAPTISEATSSTTGPNTPTTAEREFVPAGSLFTNFKIGERLGIGLGLTPSFGFSVDYGQADYGIPDTNLRPHLFDEVVVMEFSLGAAYKFSEELSIGAAWRISRMEQDSSIAFPLDLDQDGNPDTLDTLTVSDMTATDFSGYRLGIQYRPKSGQWGLGGMYRSGIDYKVDGTLGGQFQVFAPTPGPVVDHVPGPGSVVLGSIPPEQIAVGGDFRLGERWTTYLQYEFTKWSRNVQKEITGTRDNMPFAVARVIQSQDTDTWRIGFRYSMSEEWIWRFGYMYRQAISPTDRAAWDVFPPGPTRSYMLGLANRSFDRLDLDFAIVSTDISGVGSSANAAEGFFGGNYDVDLFALHAGLTLRF
ncbi:MAG: OmpP1/FadL family transporter [Woeseiaceae bacterium]